MNENLSELQRGLLAMLGWFHEFCVQNNITYYVFGGTCLGALRHNGFIPWDDDVDVILPRPDYERLCALMAQPQQAQGRYVLETPLSPAKDFIYGYAKLYDTTTTMVERARHTIKRGIFLDVFVLDGMGKTREEAEEHFAQIMHKRKMYTALVTTTRPGRKWYKNVLAVVAGVAAPFANIKKRQRDIDALTKSKSFEECAFVGQMFTASVKTGLFAKDIFGQPRLQAFEDIEVYVPAKAEQMLQQQYGDWRQLPPVDKRVTTHDFVCIDFEHGYRE